MIWYEDPYSIVLSLWFFQITNGSDGGKRDLWIDGGIHAREWISPAVAQWAIEHVRRPMEIERLYLPLRKVENTTLQIQRQIQIVPILKSGVRLLRRGRDVINPIKALNYFYANHGDQTFFFQFEIIINLLVVSFRSYRLPMLLVYGHFKYFLKIFKIFSTLDVRIWRLWTSDSDV